MCTTHTAVAEKKDPKEQLFAFLLQYRATPHTSTEKSPAEMLFGRRIKTKLPQLVLHQDTEEQKRTRAIHDQKKINEMKQFDRKNKARPKNIKVGDKVLLKQQKSTTHPPYDPHPYTVTKVEGNRVTMNNGEKTRVRDKNKVKLVKQLPAKFGKTNRCKTVQPAEGEEVAINLRKISPNETQQSPQNTAEAQEGSQSATTTDAEERMTQHLQQLLQAAESRLADTPSVQLRQNIQLEPKYELTGSTIRRPGHCIISNRQFVNFTLTIITAATIAARTTTTTVKKSSNIDICK